MRLLSIICALSYPALAAVPFDGSGVRPGPVQVAQAGDSVIVDWKDASSHDWIAQFSLDPGRRLIERIGPQGGSPLVEDALPVYDCEFGKRRGGWDEFFDFPGSHPEGTRRFPGVFTLTSARATSAGDRVELRFDGLRIGLFHGAIAFTFFPGGRLVQQEAVVSTNEPDTAFYYNAGITMRAPAGPGDAMEVRVSYFDTGGVFQSITSSGPERSPLKVRYRALALSTRGGTVVAFPPPHQYFMPRDFTSNMGFTWHFAWRGVAGIGIRQYPGDNTNFYPWMNAPPGTEQRLGIFYLLDPGDPKTALDAALRYTHGDRFPKLPGYKTLAAHWHPDFTVQADAHGADWTPPFKPVLKEMGVDSMLVFDFHLEGHPDSLHEIRLQELAAFQRFCRAQSGPDFLIIPGEEANVWLGGHYGLVFPKPVYWFKSHPAGLPLRTTQPTYGTIWHIGSAEEMYQMVREEHGLIYQAHPRTKSSAGFPDKIRDKDYFRDPLYFGTGWKALPADLSSPRLGERAFKTLDDVNNWGLHKVFIGEVDVFQIDSTHELYGHMNVNYLRIPALPDYDHYFDMLKTAAGGDSFISTGEILLPQASILPFTGDTVGVKVALNWTFPLRMAEVVWGDGSKTSRKIIPLDDTHEFGSSIYEWKVDAPGWKWVRAAIWDVAGDGGFTQPVERNPRPARP